MRLGHTRKLKKRSSQTEMTSQNNPAGTVTKCEKIVSHIEGSTNLNLTNRKMENFCCWFI